MKKILVTGGAGYIGSHTCVELSKAGYIPVIVDNYSNSEPYIIDQIRELCDGEVMAFEADCTKIESLTQVFEAAGPISGVIHFAASKAVGESAKLPLKYYHNNIESTRVLLEVMEKFNVAHFVFSSSCTVYGQPDTLPVTESSPVKRAESPYGRTKQICEDMLMDYLASDKNVQIASLRYFNPIGAHESAKIGELPRGVPNNLVPFITQTAVGKRDSLTIYGNDYPTVDGTCVRDYIHVVDLSIAHVKTIDYLFSRSFEPEFLVLNLGTGHGHSVQQVVNTFESVSGTKLNYTFGPRRPGDVVQVYADVSKSESILNWKAAHSLEDALRDAWRWEQHINSQSV